MEKFWIANWIILNPENGVQFVRREWCRTVGFSQPSLDLTNAIAKDHPGFDITLGNLKEISKKEFETIIRIAGDGTMYELIARSNKNE